jgi:hypothetical protein
MTKDAKESLTALLAVTLLFGVLWLLPLLLKDVEIPGWVQPVGFGLNILMLVGLILWRRRARRVSEKPE